MLLISTKIKNFFLFIYLSHVEIQSGSFPDDEPLRQVLLLMLNKNLEKNTVHGNESGC